MFKYQRTVLGAFTLTLGLALILAWAAGPGARAQDESLKANRTPLGTAFTYQGQLSDSGTPATGPCDFHFSLYDAASDGTQVGSTLTQTGIELSDGRFSAVLDFGVGIFTGDARWLEIAVKCAGDDAYTTLGRQALKPTPYALYANGAPWGGLRGVPADLADGDDDSGGDITAVSARTGLNGGGTSGDVTLDVDFGGSGAADTVARADHNHLGQTWTGTDIPLKIEGSFSSPNWAPLMLSNSADDGLQVTSAGRVGVFVGASGGDGLFVAATGEDGLGIFSAASHGVNVETAGEDGLHIVSAGSDGVDLGTTGFDGIHIGTAGINGVVVDAADWDGAQVGTVGDDGFHVCATGDRTECSPDSTQHSGLEIGNAQHHGVHVIEAGSDGVYVFSAGDDGVEVTSAGDDGVLVGYASGNGIQINGTGTNGAEIWDTAFDGVQINNAGRDGVRADATAIGVRADTQAASHEWGVYTPDKIYGSNVTSAGPFTFVAQNGDAKALEPGDVVAGIGLAAPFADGPDPIPLVGLADDRSGAGVIGVALSHFVAQEEFEEIETENGVERLTRFRTHSVEGPIAPGEHLLIVVLGVAQIKVDPETQIEPGQRLTASDVGSARALRTETLNGMQVTEGAPLVGVALAAPEPGETTIPVFVTLR
jgi:hypothetical protein